MGSTAGASEGARLAKDVVARMDQAYYRLWHDRVSGFEATYHLAEDGENLGTIQVIFNATPQDGAHFEIKLEQDNPHAQMLEAVLGQAWLHSLLKEFSDAETVASRVDDSFTLYAKDPREGVSSLTSTVSADYCLLHEYEILKDLSSNKLRFKVLTLDGKRFVESLQWQHTIIGPELSGQVFATFDYTYAPQEQVPFISKLLISFTSHLARNQTEHTWALDLKRVAFRKTAPADPVPPADDRPQRPQKVDKVTAQWDELSQEVIAGICRSNIDFGGMITFARSLRCDIDVRITSSLFALASGTLNYWWEDADDNGLLIGEEIQIEIGYASNPGMRLMMNAIQRSLTLQTATSGGNVFRDHFIKTVRVPEGYKMKLVPTEKNKPVNASAKEEKDNLMANRSYDALYLTVSPDFRVQRLRAVKEDSDTEMVLSVEHEKVADLWAGSKYYKEVIHAGRSAGTKSGRCDYVVMDGLPMLRRLTIDLGVLTGQNTVGIRQEYNIRNCKIAWREKPLDARKFVGGEDEEAAFKDKPQKPAVDRDAELFK
ncbi:MAG TPA: hypothetical protein VLI39_04265 [Sedimentisphaerales bacterium]|nr:hypothetical protein [Sedimentisphaerales bacterium]